jgi:hypothetical protein
VVGERPAFTVPDRARVGGRRRIAVHDRYHRTRETMFEKRE